jgi:hypothetical protein
VKDPLKESGINVSQNEISSSNMEQASFRTNGNAAPAGVHNLQNVDWIKTGFTIYLFVAGLLFLRILFQTIKIVWMILRGVTERREGYTLVKYPGLGSGFSFMRWIFINPQELEEVALEDIIAHEQAHINQYHSVDSLFLNLLGCLLWFNPFIWMLRNSLQLVHEYLADEAVLERGIDKIRYQTVLLNQVAGGPVLSLVSGFSRSLIKNRITMMTTQKTIGRPMSKLFMLIFLLCLLLFSVACMKKEKQTDKITDGVQTQSSGIVAAVSPTRMNVLYLGVLNPVEIAVSGIPADKISVSIDNGKIEKIEEGKFGILPAKAGEVNIYLYKGKENIGTRTFRVKMLPTPQASIAGVTGGVISRDKILNATGIDSEITNFDFEAPVKVIHFAASITLDEKSGRSKVEISDSDKFTAPMIEMIKNLKSGQKIYFEEIKCTCPDGTIRELNSVILKVD